MAMDSKIQFVDIDKVINEMKQEKLIQDKLNSMRKDIEEINRINDLIKKGEQGFKIIDKENK